MTVNNVEKNIFICRCEDITLEEIEKAIEDGCTTLDEIKQFLRCGMGPCQGRICMPQIAEILSKKTDKPIKDIDFPKIRFPIRPIYLSTLIHKSEKKC
jgi:NAD(P)H-nitrite reductase large subunit